VLHRPKALLARHHLDLMRQDDDPLLASFRAAAHNVAIASEGLAPKHAGI